LGILLMLTIGATAMAGCGSDESARQQEIQAERAEAAQIARQDERIHQLEDELASEGNVATATGKGRKSTTSEETARETTGSSGENDSWPAGFSGWTVILGSSSSRAEAEQIASEAFESGLAQVGVLFSSHYSSLHDGYWVTYTGVLDDRAEAGERQRLARSRGFDDAYAREVAE
jgi:hypothetical protein